MRKRKKGFTLIELIAVIVILGILALVVVPLVLNIIRRAKDSTNKRSVDGYGRAVDLAMANYLVQHLTYPDSFEQLEIEYKGSKVECNINRINPDDTIYLSECKVNGKLVKNDKEIDGYYHYGILKMTNQEYVDTYGKNLEDALKTYHDEHNEYPSDYTTLELPPSDKEVSCEVETYNDGKVYLTKCSIDNEEVLDENNEDGYYHYGKQRPIAAEYLVKKANGIEINTYTNGNTHEMYTFEHSATEQTGELTDYRYIGNAPYNYVTFNDKLWRIIGVFTVEDNNGDFNQRVKIVRNEKLSTDMAWNSANTNEWSTSTLNTYLNGEYYNGLDATSKSMIVSTKYYLGGNNTNSGVAETYYSWERGTAVYNTRNTSWIGKIALIYPSEYIYTYALGVDDICFNSSNNCSNSQSKTNSWMYGKNIKYQWLLSPKSNVSADVFRISNSGSIISGYLDVKESNNVLPTLYLSSLARIKSGNGSIDSPYEFEL